MERLNLEPIRKIATSYLAGRESKLIAELEAYDKFGEATRIDHVMGIGLEYIPIFINEFWTSKQRAAHSLHEISYRACFKPQLPKFFIERLTDEGDLVYDPFMGRGTTLLEAIILKRNAIGCDVNPLSVSLLYPRLNPPTLREIQERLDSIGFAYDGVFPDDFTVFYHPDTLRQICGLRKYLIDKVDKIDSVDAWIRMVATNRLTGHSKGFFSVYTLPPNQAVTIERQKIINARRRQEPDFRNVPKLILKKSRSLLSKLKADELQAIEEYGDSTILLTQSCEKTSGVESNTVSLVVTSPPFLDVVDYATDNWLRCWFNGIDEREIPIWTFRKVEDWQEHMNLVFKELKRVLKPNGYVAFEVGEVRNGKVRLEENVIPAAEAAGLKPILVLINSQEFTKTSNCWGVDNLSKGTNTNRIVLLKN